MESDVPSFSDTREKLHIGGELQCLNQKTHPKSLVQDGLFHDSGSVWTARLEGQTSGR